MNDITFTPWISIVGPLGGLMFTILAFLHHKIERRDERIMRSEERNNRRRLATETKIFAIMSRLEMGYANSAIPSEESTKK